MIWAINQVCVWCVWWFELSEIKERWLEQFCFTVYVFDDLSQWVRRKVLWFEQFCFAVMRLMVWASVIIKKAWILWFGIVLMLISSCLDWVLWQVHGSENYPRKIASCWKLIAHKMASFQLIIRYFFPTILVLKLHIWHTQIEVEL